MPLSKKAISRKKGQKLKSGKIKKKKKKI